jgi:diguanylate cyclase (GGDEF)-like protein
MSGSRTHPGVLDAETIGTPIQHPEQGRRRRIAGALDQTVRVTGTAQLPSVDQITRDALLVRVLALLNESTEVHLALQQTLDLVTSTLGCSIGEIWLRSGDVRNVEIQCSSSDGSSEVEAFEAAGKALGISPGPSLIGRAMRTGRGSMTPPSLSGGLEDRVAETAAMGIQCILTFPIRAKSGVIGVLMIFHESAGRPPRGLVDAVHAVCHHIGFFVDRVYAEGALHDSAKELAAQASTDSLTGLKNRREFDRALRTIPRQPFAILSLDVDGLKVTNDTEGHAAGDSLLRLVGHTLGQLVRGWDVMARVGGDEFAALLPEVGVFGANVVAERMRLAMHALLLPGTRARITVGWSAAPAGADPVSVWQRADESLYEAKHAGGDRVAGRSYVTGEAGDIAERSYSDVIARVLEGGLLATVFQPVVNLFDGAVLGYEALARPEGFAAMDSVDEVFEAARTSGHIRDLDWVCRCRAVEDATQLPKEATLFLNISASSLIDPVHGVDQLLNLLRSAGRAPSTVVLDITEHERIRDYDSLSHVLAEYRAEGIRFALDDVGEGHSTLELLAASSSEYLKLGRSLTMTSSRVSSRAVIDATMTFARISGAMVIAEGVENEYAADLMKAAGIRLGQGFGLGKPTAAADTEDVAAALVDRAALRGLRPRSFYLFDAQLADRGVAGAHLTTPVTRPR